MRAKLRPCLLGMKIYANQVLFISMIIQISFVIPSFALYYRKVNRPIKYGHFSADVTFDDILVNWIWGKLTFNCISCIAHNSGILVLTLSFLITSLEEPQRITPPENETPVNTYPHPHQNEVEVSEKKKKKSGASTTKQHSSIVLNKWDIWGLVLKP